MTKDVFDECLLKWKVTLNTLVALATITSTLVAVGALVLVWVQLRFQARQLRQFALTELHREITRPEMQRAIRRIYASAPPSLEHPKDEATLEQIELVLNCYDLLATRVRQRLIPERETIETEWQVVLRLWHQLEAFWKRESALRNGVPYKPGFEWLVQRSQAYQAKNFPAVESAPFARDFLALVKVTQNP